MTSYLLVPEPERLELTGRHFAVDGFTGLSPAVMEAMNVAKGGWRFEKDGADGVGAGEPSVRPANTVEIEDGVVRFSGSPSIAQAAVAQLLRQSPGRLPEGRVTERPLFPIRGFHQDIGRGGVPTVDTWKRMLRWLFLCKYTHLGIYFEDLFPWEKYPDIGSGRGRMSRQELREVIEYGAALGIEVFPSMNLAGHMENILAVKPFWKFSDWHWLREGVLDLSNPEAREFACELLAEVIDACPSRLIHIGGDEPWALGRGKGLDHDGIYRGPELYRDHHATLIDMVRQAGRTPVLWGDMISGSIMMGEMVSEEAKVRWRTILDEPVWRDVMIANWKYNPSDDADWFAREIDVFKSRGMAQLACTGLRNSMTFYPRFDWALHNNLEFLEAARREDLPGYLVTSWGGKGSECLLSYLDPLILSCSVYGASHEVDWKPAWCALTGESKELAEIRERLGGQVNPMMLREAIYRRSAYTTLPEGEKKRLLADFKAVARRTETASLPDDLLFQREMLQVGIRVAEGTVKSGDLIALASHYAELWKAERKEEGLDVTIARLWGAAGCYEYGMTSESQGWFSSV